MKNPVLLVERSQTLETCFTLTICFFSQAPERSRARQEDGGEAGHMFREKRDCISPAGNTHTLGRKTRGLDWLQSPTPKAAVMVPGTQFP